MTPFILVFHSKGATLIYHAAGPLNKGPLSGRERWTVRNKDLKVSEQNTLRY